MLRSRTPARRRHGERGRRAERRGHHEDGPVRHDRPVGDGGRPVRGTAPGRRPDRRQPHRLDRLQPVDGGTDRAPPRERRGPDPHRPPTCSPNRPPRCCRRARRSASGRISPSGTPRRTPASTARRASSSSPATPSSSRTAPRPLRMIRAASRPLLRGGCAREARLGRAVRLALQDASNGHRHPCAAVFAPATTVIRTLAPQFSRQRRLPTRPSGRAAADGRMVDDLDGVAVGGPGGRATGPRRGGCAGRVMSGTPCASRYAAHRSTSSACRTSSPRWSSRPGPRRIAGTRARWRARLSAPDVR